MFIDTHAHLDFDSFDNDREVVIQRAIQNQVLAIITIGTDLKSSKNAVLLAEKYASIYAAVGIHPSDCAEAEENDFEEIRELAKHEKVIAIGEVGLDYYRMHAEKDKQKDTFGRQIELARELNLPLIIHNREAHKDVYDMIVSEKATEVGGVLHSFTGDESYLENILLTNFHISFTGAITYKNNDSEALIANVPLERLLLETDSPFLTPMPLRGKRNEPSLIVHTAKRIAEIRGITVDQLAEVTSENAGALFRIKF
ncbi:MAG: TatD family hydrolase [Calditrichaceae bacterium]